MHGTTEPQRVPPKYTGAIASGIVTAGVAGIALIWITAYAASPHRPAITPGITAIAALTGSVGATIIIVAIALRIFMAELTEMRNDRIKDKADTDAKLAAIQKAVDDHGHNVLVDHTALHRDAVKSQAQAELLIEASTRILAYEEQRSHLLTEDHHQLSDLRQQMAEISLDLSDKRLGEIADAASRRAFRELYDAMREAFRKRAAAGWSQADSKWMEDVAKAFELGKQMGNDKQVGDEEEP